MSDLVGNHEDRFFFHNEANIFSGEPPSNPCDPSPCNAGTCTVSVNNQGYTCTCQPWMTGPNCEERIVLPAAPPGGVEPEPVIPKPPGLSEGGSPTVPESPSGGAAPGGGSPTGPLEGAPGGLAPSGELPGAGGFPQGPGGLPGSGGQPQEPGTPETGGQPQVPGAPGTGGQPQGPGVPGTGGQPQGPGAPGKGSQPQGQGGLSPPGGLPGSEESPEPTLASPGQPGGPVQPARNPFQRGSVSNSTK